MFPKILGFALLAVYANAQKYQQSEATSYISYSQNTGSSGGAGLSLGVGSYGGSSGLDSYGGSSYISYDQGGLSNSIDYAAAAVPLLLQAAPVQINSKEEESYGPAKYQFKYGVQDTHTGDIKEHEETRDGDVVKGSYSLHEPDGTILTVKYTADKKSGFNAEVLRQGKAAHPQYSYKN